MSAKRVPPPFKPTEDYLIKGESLNDIFYASASVEADEAERIQKALGRAKLAAQEPSERKGG